MLSCLFSDVHACWEGESPLLPASATVILFSILLCLKLYLNLVYKDHCLNIYIVLSLA